MTTIPIGKLERRVLLTAAALFAVAALLGWLAPARAHAGLLDLPGIAKLAAEKAAESKACGFVSLEGQVAAGGYLPIWTFHARYDRDPEGKPVRDPLRDYFELGLGGTIQQGERFRPRAVVAANLPALSRRLWSGPWAADHLTRSVFPPVWLGPSLLTPMPWDRVPLNTWAAWKARLGFIVAVAF